MGRRGYRPHDSKKNVDPILTATKVLSKLYFETLDNQREKTIHLYADDCSLCFNGHRVKGGENINKFWTEHFPPSLHTIKHHTYNHAPSFNLLIILHSGSVNIEGKEHMFTQTITCTMENERWKIMSDDYRFMT